MTKTKRDVKEMLKECKRESGDEGGKVIKYTSRNRRECALVKVVNWGTKVLKTTIVEIVEIYKGFRDCKPGDKVQIDPRGLEVE